MIFCSKLVCTILNFVSIGIDILAFFLVVRAVILWKEIPWLKPFNDAGKGLIDGYTNVIDRLWNQIGRRHLTGKGKLLIGLGMLELANIFLFGAVRLFQ